MGVSRSHPAALRIVRFANAHPEEEEKMWAQLQQSVAAFRNQVKNGVRPLTLAYVSFLYLGSATTRVSVSCNDRERCFYLHTMNEKVKFLFLDHSHMSA